MASMCCRRTAVAGRRPDAAVRAPGGCRRTGRWLSGALGKRQHAHHQRCVFHAFSQVEALTPPRNPARRRAQSCTALPKRCSASPPLKRRRGWVEHSLRGSERWDDYRRGWRRERRGRWQSSRMNASSRRGDPLARLINAGTLFSYLDPRLGAPRSPSGHQQPH